MVFGEILKTKRLQKKWTQEELSEKLQISRPTISNWESDKTLPDISNLLKMSVLFGCSLDQLLKEEIKLTTKTFKTLAYANGMKDNIPRLRIQTEEKTLIPKGAEVKANVNIETGEVTFFIEQEELKKINK